MSAHLPILGMGAVTPVGLTAPESCAAIRASISGFAESAFFQKSDEPVPLVTATVPLGPSPEDDEPFDRLVRMAARSLGECAERSRIDPSKTALLLGVGEALRRPSDGAAIIDAIEGKLGFRFAGSSKVFSSGNVAAFHALEHASQLLMRGVVGSCVIGAVDSYLNAPDLNRLQNAYRIAREGVPQGMIPGEGAAFVAVGEVSRSVSSPVSIIGVGLAAEDAARSALSDEYSDGGGLQSALEMAVRAARMSDAEIAFRVSDMNGEYYRGIDSVLAQSRFYRAPREELRIIVPAGCTGDIGAAMGPLSIVVAATSMEKGYAPGSVAMCEAASDGGLRAACVIRGPSGLPSR